MPGLHCTPGQCQDDDTVRILRTRRARIGRRGQSRGGGRGLVARWRKPPPAIVITGIIERMGRTPRNLWSIIVSWENLLLAYKKCRRRKRFKRGAVQFDYAWESNLLDIQRQLIDGTYLPGSYRHFHIFEPKKRKISAAPFHDRIVHHAVVNVLEPIFDARFIYDSYACRRGKGTHRAVDRAQAFLRRYAYCMKTDIVRFFPNVDHQVMFEVLSHSVRDDRLMALISKILASGEGVLAEEATERYFPGDDLFALLRPKGLPIGNLTSQFFANVLLDRIDHFVKDELRVPGFVRYADDLLLFADSKDTLWQYNRKLANRLATLRLRLHEGKTQVQPSRKGLKFLGFVLRSDTRRLQQNVLKRFSHRLRRMRWLKKRREINAGDIGRSLRAWLAHVSHGNSAGIRHALWKRARF